MPIPLWLLGGAALVGAAGHASAKETNEEAERFLRMAREEFNESKERLEAAHKATEGAVVALGQEKNRVLNGSFQKFFRIYSKVKSCKMKDSEGIDEISRFSIDYAEALELRKTADIYESAFSGGVTGATAGAAVALASYGASISATGTILSGAGAAASLGQFGAAASLTGSALATVATPLAVVAAPALLFSGISSSIKADENLSKAKLAFSEAIESAAEMDISASLCRDISRRSNMYEQLLRDLNEIFIPCVELSDKVVKNMLKKYGKNITSSQMTEEERELLAVLLALGGAIKAVIDTPLLNQDGTLTRASAEKLELLEDGIPSLEDRWQEAKKANYNLTARVAQSTSFSRRTMPEQAMTGRVSFGGLVSYFVESGLCLLLGLLFIGITVDVIASDGYIMGMFLACLSLPSWKRRSDHTIFTLIGGFGAFSLAIGLGYLSYAYMPAVAVNLGLQFLFTGIFIGSLYVISKSEEFDSGFMMLLLCHAISFCVQSVAIVLLSLIAFINIPLSIPNFVLSVLHTIVMILVCLVCANKPD